MRILGHVHRVLDLAATVELLPRLKVRVDVAAGELLAVGPTGVSQQRRSLLRDLYAQPDRDETAGGYDPFLRVLVVRGHDASAGDFPEDPRDPVEDDVGNEASDDAVCDAVMTM